MNNEEPQRKRTYTGEQNWRDIDALLTNTEVVPTAKPRSISEQFVIVSGGGSARAYIYDTGALSWRYTALT